LAHHPFLLRGVKTIAEETHKGALLTRSIRTGVDLYSAHTNADVVSDGVSAALASALGLQKSQALVPTGAGVGHGRIGDLPEPVSLGDFARLVGAVLPSTAQGVKVAGDYNMPVQRIALCGGAGDSFISAAVAANADVYLTSDLRHHPAQDARESASLNQQKPALIDVAHWAGEWIWLDSAASKLSQRFSDVQFVVSHIRTDPWDFVVTQ
jgi:dinuclear metal center YbgI/SA1388 family protein